MFDPIATSTPAQDISYVISWIRDLGIFGIVLTIGWNARAWFQEAKDFTVTIRQHMVKMEHFAFVMENNHAKHIQQYLYLIAKDRNVTSLVDPNLVSYDPMPPPEEGGEENASRV
jgi:hypothetical protein